MNVFSSWKSRARRLKHDGYALILACRDPRVPWYARLMAIFAVGYLVSPIDLIPDVIPGIGFLDDRLIVPFLFGIARRLIPTELLAEHRSSAELRWPGVRRVIGFSVAITELIRIAKASEANRRAIEPAESK